jgi:succinate dehydrogenase / fumarate reductase cytochrome b subunit
MIISGPLLSLFIIYHLLHFTVGSAHPNFNHHDAYRNVVIGFSSPLIAGVYIVAMLALALHLSHGVWSMLQTVGVNRPNWEPALRKLAIGFAALICGGFISIPTAVLFGLIK